MFNLSYFIHSQYGWLSSHDLREDIEFIIQIRISGKVHFGSLDQLNSRYSRVLPPGQFDHCDAETPHITADIVVGRGLG